MLRAGAAQSTFERAAAMTRQRRPAVPVAGYDDPPGLRSDFRTEDPAFERENAQVH